MIEAYEVLIDPNKRAIFDLEKSGSKRGPPPPPAQASGSFGSGIWQL
jgi:DnaJ-class molecular chaperone